MKVTINSWIEFTISGIGPDEIETLISMIRGAGLEERRQWFPVLETLTKPHSISWSVTIATS